jgi:hypothetical protein
MPNTKFSLIYLAVLLVLVLGVIAFIHPDEALKAFLIGAGGALMALIQMIFNFFYGSSQGSKDKDALNKGNSAP